MKDTILLVDDEKSILNSIIRLFLNEKYEILTAASGKEALQIMEENDVSLIISDHRMPEMTGVEFLSLAKDIAPDAIRIMLTGYADLEASINAINEGEVYRFITKPWNDEELLITVKRALEHRELILQNRRLTKTVKKQAAILEKLEDHYPGISEVTRSEDGAIVIDEDDLDDDCLPELLKANERCR